MNQDRDANQDVPIVVTEAVSEGIVKITLNNHYDPKLLIRETHGHFMETFKEGNYQILFDMRNILFPSSSLFQRLSQTVTVEDVIPQYKTNRFAVDKIGTDNKCLG